MVVLCTCVPLTEVLLTAVATSRRLLGTWRRSRQVLR
jgi:hypothetical protein